MRTTSNTRLSFIIAACVLIFFGLALIPFSVNFDRDHTRPGQCLHNVKTLGLACAMYADTHDGKLPASLDDLLPIVNTTKVFFCPSSQDSRHYNYEFTGVTNKWQDNSDVIILREIEANHHGRRMLLYNDGHAQLSTLPR